MSFSRKTYIQHIFKTLIANNDDDNNETIKPKATLMIMFIEIIYLLNESLICITHYFFT